MKKFICIIFSVVLLPIFGYSQTKLDSLDFDKYIHSITGRFSTKYHSTIDTTRGDVLVRTVEYNTHDDATLIYTQQGELIEGRYYPYRQRIYAIYQIDDYYIGLQIFSIPNEVDFWNVLTDTKVASGKFNLDDITFKADTTKLKALSIYDLPYKVGCDIKIYKDNLGAFRGSTNESDCKGSFKGATYTTTEFVIYPHEVISWERGWNDEGTQIWGPKTGPYIYSKVANH